MERIQMAETPNLTRTLNQINYILNQTTPSQLFSCFLTMPYHNKHDQHHPPPPFSRLGLTLSDYEQWRSMVAAPLLYSGESDIKRLFKWFSRRHLCKNNRELTWNMLHRDSRPTVIQSFSPVYNSCAQLCTNVPFGFLGFLVKLILRKLWPRVAFVQVFVVKKICPRWQAPYWKQETEE